MRMHTFFRLQRWHCSSLAAPHVLQIDQYTASFMAEVKKAQVRCAHNDPRYTRCPDGNSDRKCEEVEQSVAEESLGI